MGAIPTSRAVAGTTIQAQRFPRRAREGRVFIRVRVAEGQGVPAGCVARGARARPSGLNRLPMRVSFDPSDGTWRSPVAHLNGVQGVAGSNPAVPILQPAASQPFTDVGPLPFPLPAAAFATDPARFPASTTPSIVSASAAVASFKRCAVLSTGDRLDAFPRQILPQRRPETSVRM